MPEGLGGGAEGAFFKAGDAGHKEYGATLREVNKNPENIAVMKANESEPSGKIFDEGDLSDETIIPVGTQEKSAVGITEGTKDEALIAQVREDEKNKAAADKAANIAYYKNNLN